MDQASIPPSQFNPPHTGDTTPQPIPSISRPAVGDVFESKQVQAELQELGLEGELQKRRDGDQNFEEHDLEDDGKPYSTRSSISSSAPSIWTMTTASDHDELPISSEEDTDVNQVRNQDKDDEIQAIAIGHPGHGRDGDETGLESDVANLGISGSYHSIGTLEEYGLSRDDPVIKYTEQMYAYTRNRYMAARFEHEKLEKKRARGDHPGKSGIERMGRKIATNQRN